VLAIELLVHVPDRPRVLREIARVLRPGGRLALTDFTLKGEIGDPETERHLADALAAFAAMPLAPLAEYPGYLEQAGLTLDELVDITDNTAGYSYQHMLVAMRKYLDEHDDVPPELTRMFAALSAPQDQAGEPDPQPDADAQPEPQPERIILVSAHLP
jgi:SAM-dependent methyltransferase